MLFVFVSLNQEEKRVLCIINASSPKCCVKIILKRFKCFNNIFSTLLRGIFPDIVFKKYLNTMKKRKNFIKQLICPEILLEWLKVETFTIQQ
jgi:hypothetical protein